MKKIQQRSRSITNIKCSLHKFYWYWLQFTCPIHKLPQQDIDILAFILYKRQEFLEIGGEEFVNRYLFSQETREDLCKTLSINRNTLSVTLSKLRKAGILLAENKLNPKIIPSLSLHDGRFDLIFAFTIERA